MMFLDPRCSFKGLIIISWCQESIAKHIFQLKPHKISFAYDLFLSSWFYKFCTEHASNAAVLFCIKFQIDWTTKIDVMDEQEIENLIFNSPLVIENPDPKIHPTVIYSNSNFVMNTRTA